MKSRKLLTSLFLGVFLVAPPAGGLGAQEEAATETKWIKPSAVNHDVAGKEACMVCHAIGASLPAISCVTAEGFTTSFACSGASCAPAPVVANANMKSMEERGNLIFLAFMEILRKPRNSTGSQKSRGLFGTKARFSPYLRAPDDPMMASRESASLARSRKSF